MKRKLAHYMADFFVENGITECFTVTGGGAMHLNDAFGHKDGMHCTYNHHEQASAIAAEAYARITEGPALCCVTSGPGGGNALTGVMGAWLDSIPMFVVSGQVKRETTLWSTDLPLRQLGDQEINIVDIVRPVTKYAVMVTDPESIRFHLEKALFLAKNGRPSPVWIDVPLDVQAAVIETEELAAYDQSEDEERENPSYDPALTEQILDKIREAKRPVILGGTAIRQSGSYQEFLDCIEKLQIPVLTAWNAHDLLWQDHPLFCGKPGTVGTRAGNFIVQQCDLLLVLGCRMNIRMISYNRHQFAQQAFTIAVDIDEAELRKPTLDLDLPVHADVRDVMASIAASGYVPENAVHRTWLSWCRDLDKKYPPVLDSYFKKKKPMNPYAFMKVFFEELEEDEIIVCGNGSACVITFQACEMKKGQRLFTNSGCAAMGYGYPAAVGAARAAGGRRVICVDGDGSFQMNLQELQTVIYNQLDIRLFYINNDGYHSIRQTQNNAFGGNLAGVSESSGISFPDAEKIAFAYGMPYIRIDDLDRAGGEIRRVLSMKGPVFCEVVVDPAQYFEPKLSSRVLPDGRIVSPELDDLSPFLPREEYEAVRSSVPGPEDDEVEI